MKLALERLLYNSSDIYVRFSSYLSFSFFSHVLFLYPSFLISFSLTLSLSHSHFVSLTLSLSLSFSVSLCLFHCLSHTLSLSSLEKRVVHNTSNTMGKGGIMLRWKELLFLSDHVFTVALSSIQSQP